VEFLKKEEADEWREGERELGEDAKVRRGEEQKKLELTLRFFPQLRLLHFDRCLVLRSQTRQPRTNRDLLGFQKVETRCERR